MVGVQSHWSPITVARRLMKRGRLRGSVRHPDEPPVAHAGYTAMRRDGARLHTTGLTPGSAVTRSRNRVPRISKLRYWSNEAQAGDSSTTGSARPEAPASRAEFGT